MSDTYIGPYQLGDLQMQLAGGTLYLGRYAGTYPECAICAIDTGQGPNDPETPKLTILLNQQNALLRTIFDQTVILSRGEKDRSDSDATEYACAHMLLPSYIEWIAPSPRSSAIIVAVLPAESVRNLVNVDLTLTQTLIEQCIMTVAVLLERLHMEGQHHGHVCRDNLRKTVAEDTFFVLANPLFPVRIMEWESNYNPVDRQRWPILDGILRDRQGLALLALEFLTGEAMKGLPCSQIPELQRLDENGLRNRFNQLTEEQAKAIRNALDAGVPAEPGAPQGMTCTCFAKNLFCGSPKTVKTAQAVKGKKKRMFSFFSCY